MKFCPNCGTKGPAFEIPKGDNRPRFVCHNCDTIHYSNPNIITGCLPIWQGKVLLCKRSIEPRSGFWNVPSGFLENQETVEDGAKREVWEEAEAKVEITGVHALYSIPRINQVYVHFLGDLVNGEYGVGEESSETELFKEEDIPWKEIAFPSSSFTLKRFFEDRKKGTREVHIGGFIFKDKR